MAHGIFDEEEELERRPESLGGKVGLGSWVSSGLMCRKVFANVTGRETPKFISSWH